MGWYLKKSFAFGPLRLNVSKSGIGASVGVKGLRVSAGPKGRQLNAGREGLYYRASLNPTPSAPVIDAEAIASEAGVIDKVHLDEKNNFMMRVLRGLMRGR